MRKLIFWFVPVAFFLSTLRAVYGVVEPLTVPNNIFGIHIVDEGDLDDAAQLVNSEGGNWGYVVIVINDSQKNKDRWQAVFDRMRRLKLIPIIRIATHNEGLNWAKPEPEKAKDWADFLHSLNWVVKNRYVVLFNEPNHAKEWGGVLDPVSFAQTSVTFAKALKEKSEDFFLLPAGFDSSAVNSSETMNMADYLKQVLRTEPKFFDYFDGWTSHSYPNPNFSGSPYALGKGTIRSYLWEISFLKSLAVEKKLPVFITETGWQHMEGKTSTYGLLSSLQIADYFEYAFKNVWNDPQLVMVAPFVLNYQDFPFDHFSWKKIGENMFYPHYDRVRILSKVSAQPVQIHNSSFENAEIPTKLVAFSDYEIKLKVKNTGQSIWERENNFQLDFASETPFEKVYVNELNTTTPFHSSEIFIRLKTPKQSGRVKIYFQMKKNDLAFGEKLEREILIVPPPSLKINAALWLSRERNFTADILIYDKETFLQKFESVEFTNDKAFLPEIYNIVPNKNYRFVIVKEKYLPRQTFSPLWDSTTTISFKSLLPFDFDRNGSLNLDDVKTALISLFAKE